MNARYAPESRDPYFNPETPVKLRLPIPFIITAAAFLVTIGIAWANIQNELAENKANTATVVRRVETDHEVLNEIRSDVKQLLRKDTQRP
jgi:hypothetical protein